MDHPEQAATSPYISPQEKESSHRSRHAHHRRRHRNPGHRGKFLVLSLGFVLLAYLGLTFYVSVTRSPHPFLAHWDFATQCVVHGLLGFVALLCLYRLYRGSPPVKLVMGIAGAAATFGFAILLTVLLIGGWPLLWTAIDSIGLMVAAFTTWTCLASRSVSGFLNYQQDHTPGKL